MTSYRVWNFTVFAVFRANLWNLRVILFLEPYYEYFGTTPPLSVSLLLIKFPLGNFLRRKVLFLISLSWVFPSSFVIYCQPMGLSPTMSCLTCVHFPGSSAIWVLNYNEAQWNQLPPGQWELFCDLSLCSGNIVITKNWGAIEKEKHRDCLG